MPRLLDKRSRAYLNFDQERHDFIRSISPARVRVYFSLWYTLPNVISHSLAFAFKFKAKRVNHNPRDHLRSACVGAHGSSLLACWPGLSCQCAARILNNEHATQTAINDNEMPLSRLFCQPSPSPPLPAHITRVGSGSPRREKVELWVVSVKVTWQQIGLLIFCLLQIVVVESFLVRCQ